MITFVTICPCTNFVPQNRKKDDTVSGNMKEFESTSRENNSKQNNGSPGEEIAQLKNDRDQEHNSSFTEEVQKYSSLNCSSVCLAVTKYFERHTPEYGKVSHFLLLGKLLDIQYSIENDKIVLDLSVADTLNFLVCGLSIIIIDIFIT